MNLPEQRRPFLLSVSMVMLGFIGVVGSLASALIISSALWGQGPYRMNGEIVSRGEFLSFLVPFMAFYLPACLWAVAIAWSIRADHPRSRPLLFTYLWLPLGMAPSLLVFGYPMGDIVSSLAPALVLPLFGWVYLFRKSSVVDYYSTRQRRAEPWPPEGWGGPRPGSAS